MAILGTVHHYFHNSSSSIFVKLASFSNTTVAGVREVFEAATRAALAGKSGGRSGGRSGRKRDRLCCLM